MRYPLLAACLALSAFFAPHSSEAQTSHDEQAWVNVTAMGPVSGRLVYFAEVQPRAGDGMSRLDQLILRGALGWKLSPSLTVYQGYAHIVSPVEGGPDRNEERSFQQISWTMGKPFGGELSSRTRLEQRWRSDGSDMGWRLREMLRYEKALDARRQGPSALVYSELFVALNDTDWGARSGFDQVRTFLGLELPVAGASTMEVGYLNQAVNQTSGRTRMNHVASITLFYRH
jgi:hypothetical protein